MIILSLIYSILMIFFLSSFNKKFDFVLLIEVSDVYQNVFIIRLSNLWLGWSTSFRRKEARIICLLQSPFVVRRSVVVALRFYILLNHFELQLYAYSFHLFLWCCYRYSRRFYYWYLIFLSRRRGWNQVARVLDVYIDIVLWIFMCDPRPSPDGSSRTCLIEDSDSSSPRVVSAFLRIYNIWGFNCSGLWSRFRLVLIFGFFFFFSNWWGFYGMIFWNRDYFRIFSCFRKSLMV